MEETPAIKEDNADTDTAQQAPTPRQLSLLALMLQVVAMHCKLEQVLEINCIREIFVSIYRSKEVLEVGSKKNCLVEFLKFQTYIDVLFIGQSGDNSNTRPESAGMPASIIRLTAERLTDLFGKDFAGGMQTFEKTAQMINRSLETIVLMLEAVGETAQVNAETERLKLRQLEVNRSPQINGQATP